MSSDPSKIEIAQLPTLETVTATTRLLVQDGVAGTPYRQTTASKLVAGLVDEIGTGTIVAGAVVITSGTADLDIVNATSATFDNATITAGTGTLSTGQIQTLAVPGTLTVGLAAATTVNAGTVAISSGSATLQTLVATTGTVTTLNTGTLAATGGTATLSAGTITSLNVGTLSTLGSLAVSGTASIATLSGTVANVGTVAVSGTATAQTFSGTIGNISTITSDVVTAGDQSLQDSSGASPFDWALSNENGEDVLTRERDTFYFWNIRASGNLTVLGELSTPNAAISPGIPEWAYDVTRDGAVGDGRDEWVYATWGSSTATFTAFTFSGDVSIASGDTELTLDVVENSGVAFQRGLDDGKTIAITGAGLAGATLVTTIARVVDGSTAILADAASTTLSASAQEVIWPCYTSDDIGKVVWIDATQYRRYWIGLSASLDTTDTYTSKPFMAILNAYVSPFSMTLDRNLPGTATDAPRRFIIGTDNSEAIAAAGTAALASSRRALWFPGSGLYCGFTWMSGSSEDTSHTGFVSVDTTTGESNEIVSAEKDTFWLSGSARGFFTDITGRQIYNRITPMDAPDPYPVRAGIHGAVTLPAASAEDTPRIMKMGDSIGTMDPSGQNQAQTEASLFDDAVLFANSGKTWTIDYRSLGGATWAELACDANTRGGGVGAIYPWFTNTGVSWLSYATSASPVPDVFDLPQHGINDETGFHPIHFFSVITRLRALTTREGNSPDIILHTAAGTPSAPGVPAVTQGMEAMEDVAGIMRGAHAKYGYGLLDFNARAMAAQWGWDPTRRPQRRIPNYTHTISPTAPLVIPTRARSWGARLNLIGADGATVWGDLGKLRIQLSNRPDNYVEIGVDASGYLTAFVQTWGRAVETTTSITNGATTLTTSGQSSITDDLAWSVKRSALTIGTSGSGPLSSAMDGQCLLFPGTDYNSQPQRTFIEKVIGDNVARVDDFGPVRRQAYSANATCYIGGMMFVSHDAHAKSDIIITDGSGNVHKTKITGFTSRTQVTLQDAWPYTTLSSATATIWVGHICDEVTTTIDAEGDAGANPYLRFSVDGSHLILRYAVGSIINEASGYPIEVPILFNGMVLRGHGPYLPVIRCTGAGADIDVSNAWVDADMLFRRAGTQRYLRGTADAPLSTYVYGGEASHASGPLAEAVWRPVYDSQNFAV